MMVLGIDIGTSSLKIVVVDDAGRIVTNYQKEYPIYYHRDAWSEQRPEDWWQAVKEGFLYLSKQVDLNSIASIGLTGQMHGLVLLDKHNRVLRPAILWNDQRTTEQVEYLNNDIGVDKLVSYTSNRALTGFTAPKVLWVKQNEPKIFDKINKMLLPKDYIAFMLTGIFATDPSDASGTLYYDVKNKKWSQKMLEILGVTEDMLPTVYESTDAIGSLKEDYVSAFGFNRNTQVIIGGGDQACAAVANLITQNNEVLVSLGTSGVVYINTSEYFSDEDGRLHSFINGYGGHHLMGVTLSAAAALKWWVEDIQKCDFETLLSEIDENSIVENLLFTPYLNGERTPHNDAEVRAVFTGLSMLTKRSDMTKAVIEGVCFSLLDNLTLIREVGASIDKIYVNGGGAKSKVWCQILADIFGMDIYVDQFDKGPAYGAAILSLMSSNHEVLDTLVASGNEYTIYPADLARHNGYQTKYLKYQKLYQASKTLQIHDNCL